MQFGSSDDGFLFDLSKLIDLNMINVGSFMMTEQHSNVYCTLRTQQMKPRVVHNLHKSSTNQTCSSQLLVVKTKAHKLATWDQHNVGAEILECVKFG